MTTKQKREMTEALGYLNDIIENGASYVETKNPYIRKVYELHEVIGYSVIESANYLRSLINDSFKVSKMHKAILDEDLSQRY